MNILLSCFLLTLFPCGSFDCTAPDTSGSRLATTAGISINSNGIASIPAFSLDKPAVISSISLAKNRFSYDPVLAYDLDFRPWFIDNWFHYKIVRRPLFELRTGINFSAFFSRLKLPERDIHQSERYMAIELASFFKPVTGHVFSLLYWRDMGMDEGTIKGHFISLSADTPEMEAGKKILFAAGLQLFYINYYGKNDGVFISPKFSASIKETPFTLFSQATQVIQSNIDPSPGFRWNIGLQYSFL